MQVIAQILFKIAMSIASEKVIREITAVALEILKESTKTNIDDRLLDPVISALRGK